MKLPFLILCLPGLLSAQTKQIKFERLSTERGLSQSHITAILQDSRGFLWFGTEAGLNKFDGYEFSKFSHEPHNKNSLSSNAVTALVQGPSGKIWIGTFGGGLNRFDPKTQTFEQWRHDPADTSSLCDDEINCIVLDSLRHVLWIGTDGGGLNRFNLRTQTFRAWLQEGPNAEGTKNCSRVICAHLDKQGVLWLGIDGAGLLRFDPDTNQFTGWAHDPENPKSISWDWIDTIYEMPADSGRAVWLGTHGGGLNRFDKVTQTFKHWFNDPNDPASLSSNYIFSLYGDSSGSLWIGTDGGGLNRFDIKTEKFERWQYEPENPASLGDNQVTEIYEDNSAVLWFATASKGLSKMNRIYRSRGGFHHWAHVPTIPASLSNNDVHAIYEDVSGAVWIGTYGGGLNRFHRKTGLFEHWLSQEADILGTSEEIYYPQANNVVAILEDSRGELWIGTYGGKLLQFDRRREKFTYLPFGSDLDISLPTKYVLCFYESQADTTLWVGTHSGGLAKLIRDDSGNGMFKVWRYNPKDDDAIGDDDITCIYEKPPGVLWLGTADNGIDLFDRTRESFTHIRHQPGDTTSLNSDVIHCMYEDKRGRLWIGTDSGLELFLGDQNGFRHFTKKHGLPNNMINAIVEDESGNLWLSTNDGLSRFDPVVEEFKNFNLDDGLQSNEFRKRAALKSSTGELYFGGVNGFNSFDPETLADNPFVPQIVLTDFLVLNKSVVIYQDGSSILKEHISFTKEIVLAHDENVFSFEFSALDYNVPARNSYAYRMKGFDENWTHAGPKRFATYTNLNPGDYVFQVKGSNNDDIWNESGVSVRVIITPPWWQTWWAYSIYTVFIIAAFVAYRRFELSKARLANDLKMQRFEADKFREIDQMKSRFFANISHEFRTPLTLILGPLKDIIKGDLQNAGKNTFELMHRNAKRLLRLINQLLDLSKLEAGNMKLQAGPGNIVRQIRQAAASFESLAKSKRVEFTLNLPDEPIIVYLDTDKFEKIMNNLISNAFKFTPEGGEVKVTLSLSKGDSGADLGANLPSIHYVQIVVKDTGAGIAPNHIDKIFDRFYQVEAKHHNDGTGIGLALTKELVELHGGRISVNSKLGQGSSFVLSLPLGSTHLQEDEIVDQSQMHEPEVGFELDEIADLTGATLAEEEGFEDDHQFILVVEDNRDMQFYIREILAADYNLQEASNGKDGLTAAIDGVPDLIISDVMMPKMDGFEMCQKLKTDERTSHIPVILLTARASAESKLEGLETGADDYLTKPFDKEELKIRVKNLIEQRQKLRERFSREITVQPRDITVNSMDEQFLKRAMSVVETAIGDPEFSIEDFIKKVGMSRMQLHRKLRALTNQSTGEFIRSMRLKRAAQLLKQQSGTVTEIAYEVGFNNLSYFARSFKALFGKLPSEY